MQTDRELLELAAKAIGLNTGTDEGSYDDLKWWNPLESTRAAFDLMVRLELEVSFGDRYFFAEGKMSFCGEYWDSSESCYFKHFVLHGDDPSAATRRVIVLAAAEIGKNKRS